MKRIEAQYLNFSSLIEATASSRDALLEQTVFWELFWKKIRQIPAQLQEQFSVYVRGSCVAELIDHTINPETTRKRQMITQVLTMFAELFAARSPSYECDLSEFFDNMYQQVNPIPNIDVYFLVPDRKRLNELYLLLEDILVYIHFNHPGLFKDTISIIRTGPDRQPTIIMYKLGFGATNDREVNLFIKIQNDQVDAVSARSFRQRRTTTPVQFDQDETQLPQLWVSDVWETYYSDDLLAEASSFDGGSALLAAQAIRFNLLHKRDSANFVFSFQNVNTARKNILHSIDLGGMNALQKWGKYANQLMVAFCHEPNAMNAVAAFLGPEVFPNFNQPIFKSEGNIGQKVLEIFRAENIEELMAGFEGTAIENMHARKWLEKLLERWKTTFDQQATDEQKKYFGDPRMLVFLFLAFVPMDLYTFKKTISFLPQPTQSD